MEHHTRSEWRVADTFGDGWRLSLHAPDEEPSSAARGADAERADTIVRRLVYFAFDERGAAHAHDEVGRALLAIHDALSADSLSDALRRDTIGGGFGHDIGGRVRDVLLSAAASGALRIERDAPRFALAFEEEPAEALAAAAVAEQTSWIAIALKDDRGAPVPNARYRVRAPSGAVREGRLDDAGTARLDGMDPGTCQIAFPDFDGRSWS